MSRFVLPLFLLWLGAVTAYGAELSFLSTDFSLASIDTLQARVASLPADSAPQAVARLFLVDSLTAEGHLHAATANLAALSETCSHWEASDYRSLEVGIAAMTCALGEAEIVARGSWLARWRHGSLLRHARDRAFLAKSAADDRWYFEGRLFAALPPAMGQDFKKALVALRFLQSSHPDDGSVLYWTARAFERQGNSARAEELYREAAARRYPPAEAVVRAQAFREQSDGERYGVGLGFFGAPGLGFGAVVDARDDRLFDTARSLAAGVSVSTRSQVGVHGAFADSALLAPASWRLSGSFFDGDEDFYGLGMNSPSENSTTIGVRRSQLTLAASLPLASQVALSAGWRMTGAERRDACGPSLSFGFQNGPVASLAYDGRDSAQDPGDGARLAVEGYFPTNGLGSSRTFHEWHFEGAWYHPLALRHRIQVRAAAVLLDGDAPFSEYADLASDTGVSGVRPFRYRDRNLLGGAVEYQWRWATVASAAAFASVGTSSADSGSLFSSTAKAGGGVAWIGHLLRDRSANPRLELAYFGGDWVLQGAVHASF